MRQHFPESRQQALDEMFEHAKDNIFEVGIENIGAVLVITHRSDVIADAAIDLAGDPMLAALSCIESFVRIVKESLPPNFGITKAMTLEQVMLHIGLKLDERARQ